jgi:AcrR family transcriptional regulator
VNTVHGSTHGRPRSDAARLAVLYAVDDLLVEQGYAAMTMKGIAARAGVGRQTVYRWWNSKAEILLEAVILDAAHELTVDPADSSVDELDRFAAAVLSFLTTSHAGAAYRALVGEAQHDGRVAALMRPTNVLVTAARPILERAVERGDLPSGTDLDAAASELVGPTVFQVLTGSTTSTDVGGTGERFLARYRMP